MSNAKAQRTKNRRYSLDREVEKVRKSILRVAPNVLDIDIKVSKVTESSFESLIRVHLSTNKNILACKESELVLDSLDKSYLAIVKQIKKIKTKRERSKHRQFGVSYMSA